MFTVTVAAFTPMAVAAAILAIANAGLRCRVRAYAFLAGYVGLLVAVDIGLALAHTYGSADRLYGLLPAVLALPVGLVGRAQQARRELEQRQRVEQTRVAERTRIAREMHDVLAHRISMVSVHAGALEYHPDATPEDISRSAGVIRSSAHAALGELRQVINLLRETRADSDTRPQPTLADVPGLVEEARQVGTSVGLHIEVDRPQEVPAEIGRAVYRVVQEGLTNARKHAPASAVEVEITGREGGPLSVAVLTEPADAQHAAPPPGSGTGLIGLAERVELAGGKLEYGPTAAGGHPARHAPLALVSDSIRVLIVDDDVLVRSGLRMMLAAADPIEVVGEARDGGEMLAEVDRHHPDVVLMDLRMPRVDGIAATALLAGQPRPPRVLVLTTFDADELVLNALRAGADGFLLKDTPPAEIVRAIELVAAGDGVLSPTVTRGLIAHVAAGGGEAQDRRAAARRRLEALTEREREVAQAIGQGKTNADIAAELYMSVATVKAHVTRLLSKLEVRNRVQVALLVQDAE